ncbi:MAG: DNA ligase D [Nitrospirales bacterium]
MGLQEYQRKRAFTKTPEPRGTRHRGNGRLFVVHKHAASRLHYDFRLELDGVLKSWAVPKGPSLRPSHKRLAVHVEDHPMEYGSFEGMIPKGEYGGGTVMLWDRGEWLPEGDPARAYRRGRMKFKLSGKKLQGGWSLVRMGRAADEDAKHWLLIKENDSQAIAGKQSEVIETHPLSVATQRSLEEIAENPKIWKSHKKAKKVAFSLGRTIKDKTSTSLTKPGRRKKSQSSKDSINPLALPHALKASQPASFHPQLATLVKNVPRGEDWVHEIKFDGYRLLGMLKNGQIQLRTRNGKDWTKKFSAIAQALAEVPVRQAILDGEVVVLRPDGTSDFQALQNVLKGEASDPMVYFMFDLPHCEGYNLSRTPLLQRKEMLQRLLKDLSSQAAFLLRYSDHIQGLGEQSYEHACRNALEGIISKQISSSYQQSRSKQWVKVKCHHRQELVIGGYTNPAGSRNYFGAVLLGYYDEQGRLQYAGRVGTGFDERKLKNIHALLAKRHRSRSSFASLPSKRDLQGVHWVQPDLVAEVEFLEWTRDGLLRHPSFIGMREDKSAKDIRKETFARIEDLVPPNAKSSRSPRSPANSSRHRRLSSSSMDSDIFSGIALSHPDRVLYPKQGITKRALAEFYQHIAEWVLPHVIKRPLTLVRCPRGFQKPCFYQRHASDSLPESIRGIHIQDHGKGGNNTYLVIDDVKGLLALVQMGVLEIHPWGCREDRIDRPDRLIFDLDPGPGVSWERIIEGANILKRRLLEDGLASFVKTSGGKGLHVVVPLARRATWEAMKRYSRKLAMEVARQDPKRYIATMSKEKRKGKIFIDYLRNGFGSTCMTAYGTRARSGAPVSTPVRWDELSSLPGPEAYTLNSLPRRLASLKEDPWKGFFDLRQSLPSSAKVS